MPKFATLSTPENAESVRDVDAVLRYRIAKAGYARVLRTRVSVRVIAAKELAAAS